MARAKATSYILVAVLWFFLFMRLLSNGWTDFHQKTSLWCYSLMVVPHENWSPQNF